MNEYKEMASLAEKVFELQLVEDEEVELRPGRPMSRRRPADLMFSPLENQTSDSTIYDFSEPVIYLDKGAKKIPSKSKFEKELHTTFLTTYSLSGYGNSTCRYIKTTDYLLLFFAMLESPTGTMSQEGHFVRDKSLYGAVTASKTEAGIVWGYWPEFNPFEADGYDNYIKKIASIVGCQAYVKDELKKAPFKLVHEEPDCNWQKVRSF